MFPSSSLPDLSCSGQWSISLNLQLPSAAVASARAGSSRVTPLLSVLSDVSSGWPSVSLRVSAAGPALTVQWGPSAVREQAVSIRPNKDGWASVHLVVVRDGSRLGVWLDSSGSWLLEDVWCVPASMAVRYCTQPADPAADSSFRALRLGSVDGPSSADIRITAARVYNYALPRLSLAAESGCVEDGSCGRFLLSGWAPPAASSVPAGSISGSAVEAVGSTPLPLRATSYYLLVRRRAEAGTKAAPAEGAAQNHSCTCSVWQENTPGAACIAPCALLDRALLFDAWCRLVPGAPALHAAGAAGHRGTCAA